MKASFPLVPVVLAARLASPADATPPRWPQFLGPNGAGIAEGTRLPPLEFGSQKSLLWKTALPSGHSSPVVWGDRIFLTAFDASTQRLETLCLDRATGRIRWRQAVPTTAIEPVHPVGSPAASSPVTDGRSVFAYFGSYGLVAYDLDGKERWSRPLPMARTIFNQGTGTSPLLVGDRLVLDVHLGKDSYLLAVRTQDGEVAWKTPKPEFNGGWSTPVSWREGDEPMIGVQNPGRFTAYRLSDGAERWWVGDLPRQACATPAVGDGVLFLSATGVQGEADNLIPPPSFDEMIRHDANGNGRVEVEEIPEGLLVTDRHTTGDAGDMTMRQRLQLLFRKEKEPPTSFDRAGWDAVLKRSQEFANAPIMRSAVLAVRVGGTGDVSGSHVAWSESRGVGEVPSPLLHKGRLYTIKNGGIVLARDPASGRTVQQARLGVPSGYYASPVAAGDRVYVASDDGAVVVFEAGDTVRVLARNDLGEPILATPAIVDGRIYVRTASHLYGFGAR